MTAVVLDVLLALGMIVVLWALPVWLGRQIGKPKQRAGGWWGFWLGWLGVLVVTLLPARERRTLG
jgi:hypothetical protein